MKFYADKNGRFIGGSNHGVKPDGAVYETDNMPGHDQCTYDAENDCWLETPEGSAPAAPTVAPSGLCQGTTHAGTPCKHKANHGNYCRQHVGQA